MTPVFIIPNAKKHHKVFNEGEKHKQSAAYQPHFNAFQFQCIRRVVSENKKITKKINYFSMFINIKYIF